MTTSADRPGRGGAPVVVRPDFAFMRVRLSRLVALGFGSGLSPLMPGTVGTLLAWAVWWLVSDWLSPAGIAALLAGGFALGVWACERTGVALGAADHGAMVWDEIVAFWLVLALLPPSPGLQVWAFVVFRAFDMLKPPPIRRLEKRIPGGLGVMVDDLLAAGYTLLVFLVAGVW